MGLKYPNHKIMGWCLILTKWFWFSLHVWAPSGNYRMLWEKHHSSIEEGRTWERHHTPVCSFYIKLHMRWHLDMPSAPDTIYIYLRTPTKIYARLPWQLYTIGLEEKTGPWHNVREQSWAYHLHTLQNPAVIYTSLIYPSKSSVVSCHHHSPRSNRLMHNNLWHCTWVTNINLPHYTVVIPWPT